MLVLLSGLVGALIGATVAGGFQIWKFRRDELAARCDELCKVISDSASVASEYWATQYDDKIVEKITEAKVLGAQSLCDGLYASIRYRMGATSQQQLDAAMSDFVDAMTGGDFTVEGRSADIVRVSRVPQAASVLIVALRQAHHDTMPFSGLFQTMRENKERKLDLPIGWEER